MSLYAHTIKISKFAWPSNCRSRKDALKDCIIKISKLSNLQNCKHEKHKMDEAYIFSIQEKYQVKWLTYVKNHYLSFHHLKVYTPSSILEYA